jgi:membrane-associated protease RseP (regulator of RpoE activity)
MKPKKRAFIFNGACAAALVLCVCGAARAQEAPPPPPGPGTIIVGDGESPGPAPFLFAAAGESRRGYLGVHLVRLTKELRAHFGAPENAGVMVSRVEENSPAAKAGIAVGDIIVAVDDEDMDAIWELQQIVGAKRDKEIAAVKIIRDKKQKTLKVTVAERKRPEVDLGRFFQWSWPGGKGRQFDFDVDTEALGEAIENLEKNLDNGLLEQKLKEHKNRLTEQKDREKELEKHLKELENRIKKLEKKYQT